MFLTLTGFFSVDQILIDIPHQEQEWTWDCGLACTKMILQLDFSLEYFHLKYYLVYRYYSIPYRRDFCEKKKKLSIQTSVWTIDLFRLLGVYNVPCHFTTITLGANTDYKSMSFYSEAFKRDEVRINSCMSEAVGIGQKVEKRHVPLSEILDHLAKNLPIIALIDACNLKCLQCHNLDIFASVCLSTCVKGYQGLP